MVTVTPETQLRKFTTSIVLLVVVFVIFVLFFALYVNSEKAIDRANDLRYQSYLLADELRQSSDDLTRMVRAYVSTGNPIYKQHYQEILDIREGKKPRPVQSDRIYWDLVLDDDKRPRPNGQAVALLELMRQAEFSDAEFAALEKAKNNSDKLTTREFAAMALIESKKPISDSTYLKAILMLQDSYYHHAKADIMLPINDFYLMMGERTKEAIRNSEQFALMLRYVLIVFAIILVYLLRNSYRTLYAILGCKLADLQHYIARIGGGDFSFPLPVLKGSEQSVMGWLEVSQKNLARLDLARRDAEKMLVESEEELRMANENIKLAERAAKAGAYSWNFKTGETKWSNEFFRLFGLDPSNVKASYETWQAALHPEDLKQAEMQVAEAIRDRKPLFQEYRVVHSGGSTRWIAGHGDLMYDDSGEPCNLVGFCIEVSERKQTEEEVSKLIRELEQKNRELIAQSSERVKSQQAAQEFLTRLQIAARAGHIGIWDWNVVDNVQIWDDTICEIYGIPKGGFTGGVTQWSAHLHPDDQSRVDNDLQAALRGEREYAPEFRVIWPDGSIHYVKSNSQTFFDENRKPLRMVGTNIDITERKQTESLLLQNQLMLQDAQRIAQVGSWQVDFATNHVYWSEQLYRMQGLNPESSTPPDYNESAKLFTPESWDLLSSSIARTAESGVPYELELEMVKPDGSHGWMLARGEAVKDAHNATIGVRGVALDITERKSAEILLRFHSDILKSLGEGINLVRASDGKILFTNPKFDSLFGYEPGVLIGKHVSILNASQETNPDSRVQEILSSVEKTGRWAGEILNIRSDRSTFWCHATVSAFNHPQYGRVMASTHEDITQIKATEDEIKYLAFYDQLTRLPNRRLLADRVKQALASASRNGLTGALLFIDLDDFKTLNDTMGHNIGDLLLQEVAHRLNSCVREGDSVARLGGDEFVVMLECLSNEQSEAAKQTAAVGRKILEALGQTYQLNSHAYQNTPSIGVTLFVDNLLTIEDLLKQADIAMYQAKKAGRNTLVFFDPKMQDAINNRSIRENELRKALSQNQFKLHYQLQVDSELRPLGAEVLIRWIHPDLGQISPAEFIPMAEEVGLIYSIGWWVLETTCAQIKAWQQDEQFRNLVVSVNVSAKQLHHADFIEQVKAAVEHYEINPGLLKLELTESMLLDDIDAIISTMWSLRDIGIEFSLDDFGTGYSSLQYLKKLPLSQLKIDQSFVRDIVFDNNDRAIVRTIIAMAQSLNLSVIAEGVETEEQRHLLLNKGCTHYQGYLFSKPVPIEEFEALIKKS